MRVLVIEDDDKIASFIVNGLKQAGFATDHSTNGEDGLHRAATGHYDAAVVDLMLPRLDGLSVIEELRPATTTWSSRSLFQNSSPGCRHCFGALLGTPQLSQLG